VVVQGCGLECELSAAGDVAAANHIAVFIQRVDGPLRHIRPRGEGDASREGLQHQRGGTHPLNALNGGLVHRGGPVVVAILGNDRNDDAARGLDRVAIHCDHHHGTIVHPRIDCHVIESDCTHCG